MLKIVPKAVIVPVAIENSWKIVRFGSYPLGTLLPLKWTVLTPIEREDKPSEELVLQAENAIKQHIGQG